MAGSRLLTSRAFRPLCFLALFVCGFSGRAGESGQQETSMRNPIESEQAVDEPLDRIWRMSILCKTIIARIGR